MLVTPCFRPVFLFTLTLGLVAVLVSAPVPAAWALEPGEVSYSAEVAAGFRAIVARIRMKRSATPTIWPLNWSPRISGCSVSCTRITSGPGKGSNFSGLPVTIR